MPIETKITKERYDDQAKTMINDMDHFGNKARIVIEMVSRWGMVAGTPDGEDSKGRSKLRLATEQELVDRAFKIADAMFNELELRDWYIQAASFEMLDEAAKNIEQEIENQKALNH